LINPNNTAAGPESLMGLALELNGHLRLPDFARSFVGRAANILGARQAALVVNKRAAWKPWSYTAPRGREIQERFIAAPIQLRP